MRAYACLVAGFAMAVLGAGCGDDCGSRGSRCAEIDGDTPSFDALIPDATPDAVEMQCRSNAECADAIDCTADDCSPAGVCRHTSRSEMCGSGMTCSATQGCISGCSTNSDCDDGLFCNGMEMCLGTTCATAETSAVVQPPECDDGNACTVDLCDEDVRGCVSDNTMCDSGVTDGSTTQPFDASRDYMGTFILGATSGLSTTCVGYPGGGFGIARVTLSVSGGTLTAMGGGITMTGIQPTGAMFDVMGSVGCGQFRLMAAFSDSDNFTGTFSANLSGCGCGATTASVTGARL